MTDVKMSDYDLNHHLARGRRLRSAAFRESFLWLIALARKLGRKSAAPAAAGLKST